MQSYVRFLSITPGCVTERQTQLAHIMTLSRMVVSIRKPYLNVDARHPPMFRQGTRNIDLGGSDQQAWANIKHLTNEERDQIDLQARVILSRCAERIREMEALEKRAFPNSYISSPLC